MQTLPFDKWLVNVLERAGTETAGFFGWNSQSLLVPVVFLLGAWVHYKYRGWESVIARQSVYASALYVISPLYVAVPAEGMRAATGVANIAQE